MKQLSVYLAILLYIIFVATGCKKDPKNTATPNSSFGCRITAYDDQSFNETMKLDDLGRTIKTTYSDGTYTLFEYGPNTITISNYTAIGKQVRTYISPATAQGYIKQWADLDSFIFYSAEYDANGYILKGTKRNRNGLVQHIDEYLTVDGNLLEKKTTFFEATDTLGTSITKYEYYFDKENKGGIRESDYSIWPFFFKPTKNLLSKVTEEDNGHVYTYLYTFDDNGLPVKVEVRNNMSRPTEIRKYSFVCH